MNKNMPTFKKITQVNWFFWLIVFASLGIIATTIIRLLTPQKSVVIESEFVTSNLNNGSTNFEGIKLSPGAKLPPIPKQLPLYLITPSEKTSEQIKDNLINQFELTISEHSAYLEDVSSNLWVGDDYYLNFDANQQRYFFSKQNFSQSPNQLTLEQALSACQSFFIQYFPKTVQLSPVRGEVTYLSGQLQPKLSKPSEAEWIEIPYTLAINALPVFHKNSASYPVLCLVNSQKEVHKLEFQPIFYELKPIESIATLTIETALDNINQKDQAAIIQVTKEDFGPLTIDEVIKGSFDELRLEYRLDPEKKLAYPFYRFIGTITNRQNQTLPVEIITPAVRTEQIN